MCVTHLFNVRCTSGQLADAFDQWHLYLLQPTPVEAEHERGDLLRVPQRGRARQKQKRGGGVPEATGRHYLVVCEAFDVV